MMVTLVPLAMGWKDHLMIISPENSDWLEISLGNKPHVSSMVMRGRPMKGWLRVAADGVCTKKQLEPWVKRGVAHARSLPAKPW